MIYRISHAVLSVLFRYVWRAQVHGVENIPPDGPLLVASNHLSFIDSIMIPLAVPRQVHFLAKSEYFEGTGVRGWFSRTFFRALGAMPVPRDDQRGAQASLNTALAVLRRGEAFGIYPEGTRSRDGRLYRGRTGVAWLALTAGAPVVPVGLAGTDRVQPVGARVPRVRRVVIRFGRPIDPAAYADAPSVGQARRRLTDDVMDAIAELSGQERVPTYNARAPEE